MENDRPIIDHPDGYLIVSNTGTKYWKNSKGKLHRENDLPAVEYFNGTLAYYINGEQMPYGRDHRSLWYLHPYKYRTPEEMPLELYMIYIKWELNKKKNKC